MPLVYTSGEYHRQTDQHEHDHVYLQPAAGIDPVHSHIQEQKGHHVLEDIDCYQRFCHKLWVTLQDKGHDDVGRECGVEGDCATDFSSA